MSMKFIRYQVDGEWEYANVKTVGDITTLKTQSKEDVVSAINSLFDENGKITDDILDQLEWIKDQNGEYIEKVENMAEIIEITDESLKHMNELTQQLERDQRAMEEMHSALLERQQEIIADLEKKIDKDKYDAEYNEIVSDLRDKVSSFDFANLTGKFTKMEKDFKNLEDEVSNKMSKTEFDDAVGVNKWTIDSYDVKDTDFTKTHASFEFIKEKTPEYSDEIDDSISLLIPKDVNRINHLFTNVKMNNDKTITLNIEFKNSVVVYMNGAILHRDYSTNSKRDNVSLSLREGWNTIEILLGVSTVSPVLTMSTKLSDSVDKMTTTIGVGDKNESRLTHSETMWKQTQESIALKADKTVVSQIGNNVKDNSALLEVMSDEIKQTVKEKEFNEYTKRLTDAEAKIKVNSDAIEQTVRKTEFDKLNNEVKDNKTKIDQTAEKIEQTATSVEVIGEKADSLRDEFDNLEFGGRNYIVESKINSHVAYNTKPTYDNHILTTVKTDESNYITISVDGFIPENKYYTIHGYMKVDGEPVTNAMWGNKVATTIGMNLGDVEFYVDDETGYFEITQLWRGDSRWLLHTGMYNEIRGKTITIEEFMFEQSTKASDYTEAPENKDERLRLAETLISQNSKEILLKASQADLNKVTGDLKNAVAKIELNSESIKQSVTKEEFNNLEYENRNYIREGNYVRSTQYEVITKEDELYDQQPIFKVVKLSTGRPPINFKTQTIRSGETFTFSLYIKTNKENKGKNAYITLYDTENRMALNRSFQEEDVYDEWERLILTYTNEESYEIKAGTYFYPSGDVDDITYFTSPKLEKGSRATPWSPAPEDMDARMTKAEATIETTVEGIKLLATKDEVNKKVDTNTYNSKMSSLDTTIKGINAKVESTETSVNGLTGEMESAKKRLTTVETTADGVKTSVTKLETNLDNHKNYTNSQFNVMSDKIETKVSTIDFTGNKIASLISQDAKNIKMIAEKIILSGDVSISNGVTSISNGKITNAMIAKAGISFAKIYDVEINNAMIKDRLTSEKITIGSNTKFEDGYDPTDMEVGGENLLVQTEFMEDTSIDSTNGELKNTNNANATDFIEVGDNKNITVSRKIGTTNNYNNNLHFDYFIMGFYDSNKKFIDGNVWNLTLPPKTFKIPDKSAYVRFSSSRGDLFNLKAEFGRIPTSWSLSLKDIQAGVEVGGSNIIYYTTPNEDNASQWVKIGVYTGSLEVDEAGGIDYFRMPITDRVETGDNPRFRGQYVTYLRHGQTYTASWKAIHSNWVSDEAYGGIYNDSGGIVQSFRDAKRKEVRKVSYSGSTRTEYEYTFTFTLDYPTAEDRRFSMYLGASFTRATGGATFTLFRDIQLEEGTKKTSWEPNPEDYESFAKRYADGIGSDAKGYADGVGGTLRGELRLTAPLPNSITMNTNGITATASGSSKYARFDNRGLFVKGGAIQIERPDGAIWMEDGMVNQDYAISGFDPHYMQMGVLSDINSNFDAFYHHNGFYQQYYGALDGRGTPSGATNDIRNADLGYTIRFQRYEFIHSARYLVLDFRVANATSVAQFRVRLYEGDSEMASALVDKSSGLVPLIVDLGTPKFDKRHVDLRVGWLKNGGVWGDKDSRCRFRINRVYQTDSI